LNQPEILARAYWPRRKSTTGEALTAKLKWQEQIVNKLTLSLDQSSR